MAKNGYGYHPNKTERDEEYVSAYLRFETLAEASKECKVSAPTVARALERAGIPRTGSKKHNEKEKKITDEQLIDCAKSMTRQEIADKYKMHVESLARRMRQLGIHAVYAENLGNFKPRSDDELRMEINSRANGNWEFIKRVDAKNIKVKCRICGTMIVRTLKTVERHNTPCPECKRREQIGTPKQIELIYRKCKRCGKEFFTLIDTALYCSSKCKTKMKPHNSGYRNRARHYGVYYDSTISLKKVIERDHNICQICGKPCDATDTSWGSSGPMYPSIDHITAFANGGTHTWDNVQLAHIICNSYKRDLDYAKEA